MIRKKTVLLLAAIASIIITAIYGTLVWQNNRHAPPPTQQEIAAKWENSVVWLMENREHALTERNPILWWMISESAKLTGDSRLKSLLSEFRAGMNTGDVWQIFFEPDHYWGTNFPETLFPALLDYQQYFLFTLSCSKQLSETPLIEAQNQTNFCNKNHLTDTRCVTHQLMGFRFAQRIGCDRIEDLPKKIGLSQNSIVNELRRDPRVVDVYLQRVLMLVDSGAAAKVNPRWLQRVLDAQLADGSWTDLQPLLPIGKGRYFGFKDNLFGIGRNQSNFHATAQGLWLLSLLQQEQIYQDFLANE